jgi:hypothetical protein
VEARADLLLLDDQERLRAARHAGTVAALERLLQTLGPTACPEEWTALSSGHRLEIERMQGKILDYLVQGAPPVVSR